MSFAKLKVRFWMSHEPLHIYTRKTLFTGMLTSYVLAGHLHATYSLYYRNMFQLLKAGSSYLVV